MADFIDVFGSRVPVQGDIDAAFGADASAYAFFKNLPEEYQRGRAEGCKIASRLFFGEGKLEDYGRALKSGVQADHFFRTLRAMLISFQPQHEVKEACCGALIDACTGPLPHEAPSS